MSSISDSEKQQSPGRQVLFDCIRWVLVLPAAIVGGGLLHFLWVLATRFFASIVGAREFAVDWFELITGNLLWGVLIVFCGSITAPRYRKQTAAVISGALLVVLGASGLLAVLSEEWPGFVEIVLVDIGAIGMTISIFRKENIFSDVVG